VSTERRRILVVSESLALANNLLVWLREAGYDPAVVTSFNAGKEHLRTAPDILITELKLREYNGLHLALRAHREGIPTAVIGSGDAGSAVDAQEFGARYLDRDSLERDDILLLVDGLLSTRRAPNRDNHSINWVIGAGVDSAATPAESSEMNWQFDVDPPVRPHGRTVVH
jgi:DNA-binding response OmpR family regulator